MVQKVRKRRARGSINTLRPLCVEASTKVGIKLVGITEKGVQRTLLLDVAQHVFISTSRSVKAPEAFSAITNMSTGIFLDFPD
jgi:hypothetical protein